MLELVVRITKHKVWKKFVIKVETNDNFEKMKDICKKLKTEMKFSFTPNCKISIILLFTISSKIDVVLSSS